MVSITNVFKFKQLHGCCATSYLLNSQKISFKMFKTQIFLLISCNSKYNDVDDFY